MKLSLQLWTSLHSSFASDRIDVPARDLHLRTVLYGTQQSCFGGKASLDYLPRHCPDHLGIPAAGPDNKSLSAMAHCNFNFVLYVPSGGLFLHD